MHHVFIRVVVAERSTGRGFKWVIYSRREISTNVALVDGDGLAQKLMATD